MQSYLLLGNIDDRKSFIDNFIKDHSIKNYNITRFENPLKIKDAREIKKSLIIKATKDEKRLILVENDINIEAQNALLKTLEELPENVFILISIKKKDNLLPTVTSRCQIVFFRGQQTLSSDFDSLFQSLSQEKDFNNIFSFYQSLSQSKELKKEDLEEIILSLRGVLIHKILNSENLSKDKIAFFYKILAKLSYYYPLMQSNNLNIKIVIDNIALESLPN